MKKIEISKENVELAYKTANDNNVKNVLRALFGNNVDENKPKNVMERIQTVEDAITDLGESNPLVMAYRSAVAIDDSNLLAYLKLRIVVAALNEGWIPPQDCKTDMYWAWFWMYTQEELDDMSEDEKKDRAMISIEDFYGSSAGFGYAISSYAPSDASAYIGSRLCLKTRELAIYCGKQFIELWAEYQLIK